RNAGVDRELAARVSVDWPPGLLDVLFACLDPDSQERPADGNEMARQLELCLAPKAHTLLAPGRQSWRRLVRHFPGTCVVVGTVLPNALAAVFNYYYNRREIINHLQNSQKAFEQIPAVINAIAFPVGIALLIWFTRPVAAAVRQLCTGGVLTADTLPRLRRNCLWLGHVAAGISLTLWLIAAPAYPIALQLEVGSVPVSAYVHFVASLTLCGLIAAAYPFFIVSSLSVCSFYPALVRIETMSHEDLGPLVRLNRASAGYLLLAASVPMLSVVILVLIGLQARFALGVLAAAGLAGFVLSFLAYRTLQADLAALTMIAAPPGETGDSTSVLSRSF